MNPKVFISLVVFLLGAPVAANELTQSVMEDLRANKWHKGHASTTLANQNFFDPNPQFSLANSSSSTNFFRLFTRGIEKPLNEKEDISAKFRLKPNGESSVLIIFRFH